jgi:hypothetical protein
MRRFILLSFFAVVVIMAFPGGANAANLNVTNTNDSGPGSLRKAIIDANDGGVATPRSASRRPAPSRF